jgi:hypothetical protein
MAGYKLALSPQSRESQKGYFRDEEKIAKKIASVLSNPNFRVNPLARSRRFSAEALTTNPNF